jgi:hypothetical protein
MICFVGAPFATRVESPYLPIKLPGPNYYRAPEL